VRSALEELDLQIEQRLEQAREHRSLQERLTELDGLRTSQEAELERLSHADPAAQEVHAAWRDRLSQLLNNLSVDARLSQALNSAPDPAEIALSHALAQLHSLEVERRAIVAAIAEREQANEHLDRALEQKAALLQTSGAVNANAIAHATHKLLELRAQRERIHASFDHAQYTLQLLTQLVETLRSADILGDFSVLGFDLLSDPLKHAALSSARGAAERAAIAITELRQGLSALGHDAGVAFDEQQRLAAIAQTLVPFGLGITLLDTLATSAWLDVAVGFTINRAFVDARNCREQVRDALQALGQRVRRVNLECDQAHQQWRALLCKTR
jgi:hypothetical protein